MIANARRKSHLRRSLFGATALAGVAILASAESAEAAASNCTGGPPTYTCTGSATTSQNLNIAGPINIVINSPFSVTSPSGTNAFDLRSGTAPGTGGFGISFEDAAGSHIEGAASGISASNGAATTRAITTGDITIRTGGGNEIIGNSGSGISATNNAATATGALTIETDNAVTGSTNGINAINYGGGNLVITTKGNVTGNGVAGINATQHLGVGQTSSGNIIITTEGDVTGASSNPGVTTAYGILANNNLANVDNGGATPTGSITIIAKGKVSTTNSGNAISASNSGTAKAITVETYGVVSGYVTGISTTNRGDGDTMITTYNTVEGRNSNGIYGLQQTGSGKLIIEVGANMTGLNNGILAQNYGDGNTLMTIKAGATLEGGHYGVNIDEIEPMKGLGAGNFVINIEAGASVVGGDYGVYKANLGTGDVEIHADGAVTGTAKDGIYAGNGAAAANLTIEAISVTGGINGVSTLNNGTGDTRIITKGVVTGGAGDGIVAKNVSAADTLTIDAVTVYGTGGYGINAQNLGATGTTSLTTRGDVAGDRAGIYAESANTQISIANSGAIRNLSDLSTDVAIETVGGAGVIANSGLVTGVMLLSDQGNSVTNDAFGVWNTAGGANDFGALVASNVLTNKGMIIAANGAAADPVQVTKFEHLSSFVNSGALSMQNGRAGDQTVISGAYVSDGGALRLDAALGDSSLATDALIANSVAVGAGGATRIYVTNAGGFGALTTGDGIEIVQVTGGAGASAAGAFILGAPVKAGAYGYTLYQNGVSAANGNWYLRSTLGGIPNYRAEVPVYMTSPALAARFSLAMLGTCDDRSGAYMGSKTANCGDGAPENPKWGRVFGETGNAGFGGAGVEGRVSRFERHGPSYDYSFGGFQAGMDLYRGESETGSHDTTGLYIGAGLARGTADGAGGGGVGTVDMNDYSFGAYWTHKDALGWYVDAVTQGRILQQHHGQLV